MRLDMRIPVQVVACGSRLTPAADAVLVRIGASDRVAAQTEGQAGGAAGASGWAAVRLLPASSVGGHDAACRCCGGRGGLAEALGALFVQRARAELPWFNRVVLSAPAAQIHEVAAILRQDIVVSGRFRCQAEN